ncbi:hypothetical protein GCM10011506_46380 [Marivirga lumbricoides]|uniref:Chemotaxis protein n=1 Tax=Marivirga lumbricoides TaxID=1046115 RepID=A0ABQ1N6F6_9BACT|nr:hypothetical protein GCM10011506_46380 [Marivirga lumbricoides]
MPKKIIPVIGIGASAGGLESLEQFFQQIDNNSGFAYVVIQHLAPNHKSLMDELLARHTDLPILIIEDGMELKANHIYLNPPKKFVKITNNKTLLSEKASKELSFPISSFLVSLAEDLGEYCAAIIFSGTGSDGSEGVKAIKEKGGLVVVQDPSSAKFDGMPKNAIATGAVDKILTAESIPEALHYFFIQSEKLKGDSLIEENIDVLKKITTELKHQTAMDFSEYKHSTIYRRVVRRSGLLGINSLKEYYTYLKSHLDEGGLLSKELLIGVTRFFRDRHVFDVLQQQVIPQLVENARETKQLRIWTAACSTGEEAYSIAILVKDYLKRNYLQYDVTIFATDLDKECIKTASDRIFPESIVAEIDKDILQSYFISTNGGYRIAKEIRDMIIFSVHDLIQSPPFSRIDLLSCRNFLIYLKPDIQQRLFSIFRIALKKEGFLLLGISESLGKMGQNFTDFDPKHKIYINSSPLQGPGQKTERIKFENIRKKLPEQNKESHNLNHIVSPKKRVENLQNFLIQQFVPDSVAFTPEYELFHTTGKVSSWLKLPVGEFNTHILKMLPEEWQVSFELAVNKVKTSQQTVMLKNLVVPPSISHAYISKKINIYISLIHAQGDSPMLVASFQENDKTPKHAKETVALDMAGAEKISLLENELRHSKENLQSTIEELESSNEELQSTNEELQSSNEELESVNEELYTVNAEFQEKVNELTDANNDINNLLKSTEIAIVFLDKNLNIRRFTPAIKTILNLVPKDEGRHISHFRGRVDLEDLVGKVEEVLRTLNPFEAVTKDTNDRQYLIKIMPFKTIKNEVEGIILSFIEVTLHSELSRKLNLSDEALYKVTQRFARKNELFELIAQSATDLITIHDENGIIEYISPSVYEILQYKPDELIGTNFIDLVNNKKHIWEIAKAFKEAKSKESTASLQFKIQHANGHEVWIQSTLRPIYNKEGKFSKILSNSTDITFRKKNEEELKKLSTIARQTSNIVIITDVEGKTTFVNKAFEKLTGYQEVEILGKKPAELLQGKESDKVTIRLMSEALQKKESFSVEIVNYTKKGHKYWMQIYCEPIYNEAHEHCGFFSIQQDNSQQHEYDLHIQKLNDLLKLRNQNLAEVNASLEEFAYVASHDLKEPARNVRGMMELIRKKYSDTLDGSVLEYIDVAIKASDKMNKLIESLLQFSRTGVLAEEKELVNLKQVINEAKTILSQPIKENKASVLLRTQVNEINVYPTLFLRLFQNLISNAIKYRSDKKPVILITCEEAESEWNFAVKDNGRGIPEREFQNIFKIFKTLNFKENTDSNGIGLSVCKKIVETHLGKIYVESTMGKGSTFHFSISKNI